MGVIRLLFAVSVIATHVGPLPFIGRMVGGQVAVQGFFILSGFVIAFIVTERNAPLRQFYTERLSRVFTGYWTALFITVASALYIGQNLFAKILEQDWDLPSKLLALGANLFLVGSTAMMFFYPSEDGIRFTEVFFTEDVQFYWFHYLFPAWSLPIELAFYAVAPFIVKSPARVLAVFIASCAVRVLTYHVFLPVDPWSYRFFPNELAYFMAGAGAFHVYQALVKGPVPVWVGNSALTVVLACTLFYEQLFTTADFIYAPNIAYHLLLAVSLPLIFSRPTGDVIDRVDRFAARFTFEVYLLHVAMMNYIFPIMAWKVEPVAVTVATLALAAPVHLANKQIDRYVRRALLRRRGRVAGEAAGIA